MKHAYSFLAGVALVSLCVVATRSLPGYMFLVGFGVSVISHVLLVRAIGFSRVARLFSGLSWRTRKRVHRRGVTGTDKPQTLAGVQGKDNQGLPAPVPKSSTRCNSSAARNAKRGSVVQYREMLSSVHQDVLSALCNLKVPFAEAQEAVLAAGKDGQSFDELFKTALAHVNAGVGKSRRAAA